MDRETTGARRWALIKSHFDNDRVDLISSFLQHWQQESDELARRGQVRVRRGAGAGHGHIGLLKIALVL